MGRTLRQDLLVAVMLALVLGAGWAAMDWPALSALRLPDTDDVMRLQQVRDWLGGQPFADLTQHRLGDGVAMHWTRVADLMPALAIVLLRPWVGVHAAEVAAVVGCPLILFGAALVMVQRIARALGAPVATAAIVAAIAYPATTVFLPGRIDHHGLQVVLLLAATAALLGPATRARGATAGLCGALSLVVGLETAPLFAALALVCITEALLVGDGARRRLFGFGAGLFAGAVVACAIFAPDAFAYPACDGFTAEAWRATLIGAAALTLIPLAIAGRATGMRITLTLAVGVVATATILATAPDCLHPYGRVDPLLARWWLARVAEAQPLLAAPRAVAIGYAGVMAAGLLATAWRLRLAPERGWVLLFALQLAAVAVTLAQLRGAYAGAMLAAPPLAAVIGVARRRGIVALAAAWLGSAGMLYPVAAAAFTRTPRTPSDAPHRLGCSAPAVTARLASLRPGLVLAPIDSGPAAIAETDHRLLAGPYHRNGAGNRAMLLALMDRPAAARAIVAAWHVDYVLLCDADAALLGPSQHSLAGAIVAGHVPDWLHPLAAPDRSVHLFAVAPSHR